MKAAETPPFSTTTSIAASIVVGPNCVKGSDILPSAAADLEVAATTRMSDVKLAYESPRMAIVGSKLRLKLAAKSGKKSPISN